MRAGPPIALLLLLLAAPARADEAIVLRAGLQPNTDRTVRTVSESTQTITVVKDRGLLAKMRARGVDFPITFSLVQRHAARLTTGAAQADGIFPLQMQFLSSDTAMRAPDGSERPLPNTPRTAGLRIKALATADGWVLADSIAIDGVDAKTAQFTRPLLASMFDQFSRFNGLRLPLGQGVSQDMQFKLPFADIAVVDVNATSIQTLRGVEGGKAQIDVAVSMTFEQPGGAVKLDASGFGSGAITYDVAAARIDSMVLRTLMSVELDSPEALLSLRASNTDTQTTVETLSSLVSAGGSSGLALTATVIEEGRYEQHGIEDSPAPHAASGRTATFREAKLIEPTRQLKAELGTSFGLRYRIEGLPQDKALQLEMRVQHPPLAPPGGTPSALTRAPVYVRGEDGRHEGAMTYRLSEPLEVQPGRWVFELWFDGQPLFSREFVLD